MSETSPETGPQDDQQEDHRLDSVAEKIREGHAAAGELADRDIIDPDAGNTTPGDGDNVAADQS